MGAPLLPGAVVLRRPGGPPLGKIERLYLHPTLRTLTVCTVRQPGGLLGRGRATLVAAADLRPVGPHTFALVPSARWPLADADAAWRAGLVDVADLFGKPVVTERGERVGVVAAVAFSPETQRVQRIEVASAACPVPGIVWGDEIRALTIGRIVVADAVLSPAPAHHLPHAA